MTPSTFTRVTSCMPSGMDCTQCDLTRPRTKCMARQCPCWAVVRRSMTSASANYAVSRDGTLFYAVGTGAAGSDSLVWVDREGKVDPIHTIRPSLFSAPRLSSDEQRLLVLAERDVRVYDLATGRESRLTSDGTVGGFAEWRDDGTVAYTTTRSEREGNTNVWIQPPGRKRHPADGTGRPGGRRRVGAGRADACGPSSPGRWDTDVLMIPMAAAGAPTRGRSRPNGRAR